ncbi:prephenate/arogenate dehydrogenase family protein [Methyloligella sp. 2.7D]|uniref:prephenate/arogenate dehydrogenase family protein n=1 Tax=unclassified Methyloligella TaxID=2625955 RepID=UPI00157D1BBE|nr:prephenate/arogenate dehydrogenase family protein [Methyloligella sp. GL2]QKP76465.1 prephenate/arogenate dehydrogenase family protein [Methyloligella sp. GL2]
MSGKLFDKVAILGLGLIGSSLAHGLKQKGIAARVVGSDASPEVRTRAREIGLGDEIAETAVEAVTDADLVILSVPVGAMGDVANAMVPGLSPETIVTDVGGVKAAVIAAIEKALPKENAFVPGHPIAGTEYSGPDSGFGTLFEGRWAILTPSARTTDAALGKVTAMWEALGSDVETMSPAHHDIVLATTSHLPHLIAFNIVGTAADMEEVTQSEVIKFSAGGFRDFTRIASSDPVMWRDIFLNNKEAVLEMLGRFSEDLAALQRMIRWEDGEALHALFTRTRAIRRGIIEAGQETAAPDFGRQPQAPQAAGGGEPAEAEAKKPARLAEKG